MSPPQDSSIADSEDQQLTHVGDVLFVTQGCRLPPLVGGTRCQTCQAAVWQAQNARTLSRVLTCSGRSGQVRAALPDESSIRTRSRQGEDPVLPLRPSQRWQGITQTFITIGGSMPLPPPLHPPLPPLLPLPPPLPPPLSTPGARGVLQHFLPLTQEIRR